MTHKLKEIKRKIFDQKSIENNIIEIDSILTKCKNILTDDEILDLQKEKEYLESSLINHNLNLEQKFSDFFYTENEIMNAPDTQWLINGIIPASSIGVIIGKSGSGKTTLVLFLVKKVLENFSNTYIYFIDGDMSITKIKEHGIHELFQSFKNRFFYAGKTNHNFSNLAQNLIKDLVTEQKNNPNRKYIIVEDSLSLTAPKKRGFIDTEQLYKYEREFRKYGGTSILIHHTNKSGIFADSQHIENFADYTYLIERNDFNSAILMHPQKASRYEIQNKAFKTENRKIIDEVDFEAVNISQKEMVFIEYIIEALEDGKMNQTELINHLKNIRFFNEFKVGERKARQWLNDWAEKGKWEKEQRSDEKNAIYFFLNGKVEVKTEKLEKLSNNIS